MRVAEQANMTPTSYAPRPPVWEGASRAAPAFDPNARLGGSLDGSPRLDAGESVRAGSEPTIVIGGNTSGLVSALKPDEGLLRPGSDRGPLEPLLDPIATVDALAEVMAGALRVKGVDVAVDPVSDSLKDVLERLQAEADLITSLGLSGSVQMAAAGGVPPAFESDETGLFAALGIPLGTTEPSRRKAGTPVANPTAVRRALTEVQEAYGRVMEDDRDGVPSRLRGEVRTRLSVAVGRVFSDQLDLSGPGALRSGLGLDLSSVTGDQTRTMELDDVQLARGLRGEGDELPDLIFGRGDAVGITQALAGAVMVARATVADRLERAPDVGGRVDAIG